MKLQTIREQFGDTMLRIGQGDPRLIVMVCDISHGVLQPFAKACPGRYFNLGILEGTAMSLAAGLSRSGLIPVLHTIAPFLIERAFEQIKLDFGYQKQSGNIITVGSVFDFSGAGCTHHCYGDFAMVKTIPGAEIVYPASPRELDMLFEQAYDNRAITMFRLAGTSHDVDIADSDIRFGKGVRVAEGSSLTLVATGPQLRTAVNAKPLLHDLGWDVEIVYIHTIRPLDAELIMHSALKTRRVAVIEEHSPYGGLADDVLRLLGNVDGLRFHSVSLPDAFVTEYGTYEEQCEACGLTPPAISRSIADAFGSPPR